MFPSGPSVAELPLKVNVPGVHGIGVGVGDGRGVGVGDGRGVGVGVGFGGLFARACCVGAALATRDLETLLAIALAANTGIIPLATNRANTVIRTNVFLIVVLLSFSYSPVQS